MNRKLLLAGGIAAVIAETALLHGPLGAGERLTRTVERLARAELDRQEMTLVTARLEREPLRRRLVLSGPADDFQRRELLRIMDEVPGVDGVRWASPPAAQEAQR